MLWVTFSASSRPRNRLLRGGSGSIIVKSGGTLLSLALAIFLARYLGPKDYGVYAFAMAVIQVLAIPVSMGLPQLVIRETAIACTNESWGLLRGLWRFSTAIVLLLSVVIAGLVVLLIWLLDDQVAEARAETLLLALALVPLLALGKLRGAALVGLGRVVIGQLPDGIIRPVIFMAFLVVGFLGLSDFRLTAASTMALHVVAAGAAFVVGAYLLWRNRPAALAGTPGPEYQSGLWVRAALPLALIGGLQVINQYLDILMVGLLRSDSEVGIFRVVAQGSMLVAFGLQAVSIVVSPDFARLHNQGDVDRLQHLVTQTARATFVLALPVVLIFIVFGEELLIWVFGAAYGAGYTALVVLVIGQLINASMGTVGALLNMTGYERDTLRGVAVAAVTNIVLNVLLIPPFGIEGAAVATALTLAVWNIILWRFARLRLNVNSFALWPRRKEVAQ